VVQLEVVGRKSAADSSGDGELGGDTDLSGTSMDGDCEELEDLMDEVTRWRDHDA
jgi:hypothetical protein